MTTVQVWHSGLVTEGMRCGWRTLRDSAFSSPTSAPILLKWPGQEQRGSGLSVPAPISDVSSPAYTNGVWPLLWFVSVAQKNKPPSMLSSNVQSIDLPMEQGCGRSRSCKESEVFGWSRIPNNTGSRSRIFVLLRL